MSSLHPVAPFVIGALLAALAGPRLRPALVLATPVVGFLNLLALDPGAGTTLMLFDHAIEPLRVDRLSLLFGYIFHIAAAIGALYAFHLDDRMEQTAALLYGGSAVGIVFAGDLVTLFVFWELATVTSVFLIWARRTPRALGAGFRYLVFQFVSGLLLLVGILVHLQATGTLAFGRLGVASPGGLLIFLAFGIKVGFPVLHNWLTDAYPEATPTGTVYLSAFTTKAAVYALARGYPGTEALIYLGAAMTVFPIFYAVIENDLRRVLAYSMINQLGFMVCGIGLGTALALNGAVAHAFNDVLFKGLLFMSMGSVLHMTGRINGSELGGLYKTMPKTATLCIVGAASISAFPLFSGFVSKSMVMAAALDEGHPVVWLFLLFASAGVFHHAGIKIPYFAFFAHDSGVRAADPPANMLAAMAIAAALSIGIGVYPWALYALLPFAVDYVPYTATHVIAQTQLLFFSALAFAWLNLVGLYPPELRSLNLDAEWVYRRALPRLWRAGETIVVAADRALRRRARALAAAALATAFQRFGPRAAPARSWPTGSAVIWVTALLGLSLAVYYWRGGV